MFTYIFMLLRVTEFEVFKYFRPYITKSAEIIYRYQPKDKTN